MVDTFRKKHPLMWDSVDVLNAFLHITRVIDNNPRCDSKLITLKVKLKLMLDEYMELSEMIDSLPGALREDA